MRMTLVACRRMTALGCLSVLRWSGALVIEQDRIGPASGPSQTRHVSVISTRRAGVQ